MHNNLRKHTPHFHMEIMSFHIFQSFPGFPRLVRTRKFDSEFLNAIPIYKIIATCTSPKPQMRRTSLWSLHIGTQLTYMLFVPNLDMHQAFLALGQSQEVGLVLPWTIFPWLWTHPNHIFLMIFTPSELKTYSNLSNPSTIKTWSMVTSVFQTWFARKNRPC